MDITFTLSPVNGGEAGLLDLNLAPILSTYDVTEEITYTRIIKTLSGKELAYGRQARDIITFSLFPLTDAQSERLYKTLMWSNLSVRYTNPNTGEVVDAKVRIDSGINKSFGISSVDGNHYYKGNKIVLRRTEVN